MGRSWMNVGILTICAVTPVGLAMPSSAMAQCLNPCCPCAEEEEEEYHEPCDLLLMDFFSTGWDQRWHEKSKDGRAVRTKLFRTYRGFFERELRVDYGFENNADGGAVDKHELEFELETPINRRFLVEIEAEKEWELSNPGIDTHESKWSLLFDLQLIDTYDTSVLFDLKVTPAQENGDRTEMRALLAGFHDLGHRIGLQWHIGDEFFLGDAPPGAFDNRLTYAVAPTITVTDDMPYLEHLTFFLETYGRTELDGADSGRTRLSLLPGAKWELGREIYVGLGYELPVVGPRPYDGILHFQFVKEFD